MSSRGLLSDWYTANTVDVLLDRYLCEGDLLEFDRGGKFHHWGVYSGHKLINGRKKPSVVHFYSVDCCNDSIPGDSVAGAIFGKSAIIQDEWSILEDCLMDMLSNDKVRISNQLDNEWEPYYGSDVLKRANVVSDSTKPEDDDWVIPVTLQSCKHFALNCRYGDNLVNSVCENTQKKVKKIKSGLQIAGVGAVAAGLGYFLWSKCSSTKETDEKKSSEKKSKESE